MALNAWHKVVTPREDLREQRPLDASEFAVHLDQVRDNRGPDVYRMPEEFLRRTFLAENLLGMSSEAVRRL
jgi:predicted AAA+ superfamily ATPase